MTILGISLKMYFGLQQTLEWSRAAAELVAERPGVGEVFVLPTFPALPGVAEIFRGSAIAYGAQDLAAEDAGAQTGEVSGSVLDELGCTYVEVGHAERRLRFGETATVVAAKTATALRHGLVPVLCLGEADPMPGRDAAAECRRQLDTALHAVRTTGDSGRILVAYEPHWAIGAPAPAPVEHIVAVCAELRAAVRDLESHPDSAVIYGGSAGPGLLTELGEHVDGLFLGRFAHDPAALRAVLDEATDLRRTGAAR